jgi:hypothetical protein
MNLRSERLGKIHRVGERVLTWLLEIDGDEDLFDSAHARFEQQDRDHRGREIAGLASVRSALPVPHTLRRTASFARSIRAPPSRSSVRSAKESWSRKGGDRARTD